MLPVFLLFVYLLFMHCYYFANANCIVLHSFIRISCLVIFLMSFMCLWCFDFDLFHIQLSVHLCWICEMCVCVCARLGLTSGFSRRVLRIKFCLNHFFHVFCISHVGYLILLCFFFVIIFRKQYNLESSPLSITYRGLILKLRASISPPVGVSASYTH